MPGKRKLADEIAELLYAGPRTEIDPDAAVGEENATVPIDDEQLEAFNLEASARPSKRGGKAVGSASRLRADIELEGADYRGKRSSRAAVFGEGLEEEEKQLQQQQQQDDDDDDDDDVSDDNDGEENDDDDNEVEEEGEGDDDDDNEVEEEGEEDDDDGDQDGEDEEDEDGATLRRKVAHAGASTSREMAKLEAEYGQLQNQEQEAVVAMRARGDKERAKGAAVQSQQHLYERCLEMRILLQKALQGSLRLPLGPQPFLLEGGTDAGGGSGEGSGGPLSDASRQLSALKKVALGTLEGLLALQRQLLVRNKDVTSSLEALQKRQLEEPKEGSLKDAESCWRRMDLLYSTSSGFRDSALDRWHRRTVMMGSGAIRGGPATQLRALNQSVSSQVAAAMKDTTKVLQRSRLPADACPRPLGEPKDPLAADSQKRVSGSGGILGTYDDDDEEGAGGRKDRMQATCDGATDRKRRYHVHDKIVNFMAPVSMELPAFAAQLFANLFGSQGVKH